MGKAKREEKDTVEERPTAGEALPETVWIDEEDEETAAQESRVELLCFTAGREEFCVSVFEVREIIKYQPVTAIPRCPEYVSGVISLRGEIFPVIHLEKRLGIETAGARGEEPMIIVVRLGEEPAGLLVESITGILTVGESEVELTPDVVSPEKAEFFRGVVRSGNRLASIINVERLLDLSADLTKRN